MSWIRLAAQPPKQRQQAWRYYDSTAGAACQALRRLGLDPLDIIRRARARREKVAVDFFRIVYCRADAAAAALDGCNVAVKPCVFRPRLAAAMPQAWRSPWPPAGARGGGDMGDKPTPPEGRQRPHTARHGPKRAGAQPGRSGRRPRTPPPARPERPEAARPPEKAAGSAGARHGGDPRRRPGPQAGPSAAARLRKHPRTEKGDARAARGTTGRKRTPGAPTSRGRRPRRAAHPAKRARGARRARAAEGEPPRLARPAGRATRKKGRPRRSGARAHRAARRPDRRRFLLCP